MEGGIENPLPHLKRAFHSEISSVQARLMVLVVDDSQFVQHIAQAVLLGLGHTVNLASNGLEAVEMSAHQKYDAILMDIEMPVMGGVEATARIRKHEEHDARKTIIVAMTAATRYVDSGVSKLSGFNGCLPKPFDPIRLANMLKQFTPPPSP